MSGLRDLFKKTAAVQTEKQQEHGKAERLQSPSVPEGMWVKCPKCKELLLKEEVVRHSYTCPKCGGYFRMKAKTRIRLAADKGRLYPPGLQRWRVTTPWSTPDIRKSWRN